MIAISSVVLRGQVEAVALKIRRIDCSTDDAQRAIAALRAELSPKGNVVSPEGKARTIAAFGEPLAPRQVVERICADVAARGLEAVLDYSRRIDGVTLETGSGTGFARRAGRRPSQGRSSLSRDDRARPPQYPGVSGGDPASRRDAATA